MKHNYYPSGNSLCRLGPYFPCRDAANLDDGDKQLQRCAPQHSIDCSLGRMPFVTLGCLNGSPFDF